MFNNKLSEIAIGIGPFVIEPAVSRKIGKTAMMTMTLNPTTWFSAVWAKDCGLFTEIFDSIPEMDLALQSFTQRLSQYSFNALSEMKKVYWENTDHWDELLPSRAAISGNLVLSDAAKLAIRALKK